MREKAGILPTPEELKGTLVLNSTGKNVVQSSIARTQKILSGESNRQILIVGPCSADFEDSLHEYASWLADVREGVKDKIEILMRFYTGKPRTVGGWKGLQNSNPGEDPDMVEGIKNARRIAISLIEKHQIPLADEMLHPNLYDHFDDIYSYLAVGARSTENQYHREVASGAGMPIGMKNPTSGDIKIMRNSIEAGQTPSLYEIGRQAYHSPGNQYTHGILRGGSEKSNYDVTSITEAYTAMTESKKPIQNPGVIIDCNHDNSKHYSDNQTNREQHQMSIMKKVIKSIQGSYPLNNFVKGYMVESYLNDGNQKYKGDKTVKGTSLTDPCIGKEQTEKLINTLYNSI